jgi:hypothetical protein
MQSMELGILGKLCTSLFFNSRGISWALGALKYLGLNTSTIATTKRLKDLIAWISLIAKWSSTRSAGMPYVIIHNARVTFWQVLCLSTPVQLLLCSKNGSWSFTHSEYAWINKWTSRTPTTKILLAKHQVLNKVVTHKLVILIDLYPPNVQMVKNRTTMLQLLFLGA